MKRLSTLLILITASVVTAEHSPLEITKVDTEEISTPIYQNESGERTIQTDAITMDQPQHKQWLCMSVTYKTHAKWTDQLTLEFYALLEDKEKNPMLFKGTTHFVDLPKSREHLAEMYIHFNSYARYAGRKRIKTAIIAKTDGKVIALDKKNSLDDPWWTTAPLHPVGLLHKNQTPFGAVHAEYSESYVPTAME